jgi:hypothetical protein
MPSGTGQLAMKINMQLAYTVATIVVMAFYGLACGKAQLNKEHSPDVEAGVKEGELPVVEGAQAAVAPIVLEGRLRLESPDAPLVLAEMNGLYYRAFEIEERPYNGKQMEYHEGGVEKKETLFVEGGLSRVIQWDESGQKRSEVNISPTGVRREQYWDSSGKAIAKPSIPQAPLGRTINWTFGAGGASIEVLYRGKTSTIIRKAFGEPDEELNGVWIYRGMKVQASQQLMTTVRFVIQNDIVLQVSVEP